MGVTAFSNTLGPIGRGALAVPTFTIEWSPTTNPGATPVWVDITSYVRDVHIVRGRQAELNRIEAGTCELTLRNETRAFDPTNTASPFYPNVKPMKQLRVKALSAGSYYYLFTGYIERYPQKRMGALYAEVDIVAVDGFEWLAQAGLTSTAATLTTSFGSNKDLLFTSTGFGFEENSISITYVVSGNSTLLSVTTDGIDITVNVATTVGGVADSTASEILTAVNEQPVAGGLVVASLAPGSNGTGKPGALAQTFLSGGEFIEQLASERMTAILDSVGWPATQRAIDVATHSLIGVDYQVADDQDALTQLQDASDCDAGLFFISGQGEATFVEGHQLLKQIMSDEIAVFSDLPRPNLLEHPYHDATVVYDKDLIFNNWKAANTTSDDHQEVTDTNSVTAYFKRTQSLTLPLSLDDLLPLVEWDLHRYSEPFLRVDEIVLEPGNDASIWGVVIASEIGSRITFLSQPPGTGPQTTLDCFIQGIDIALQPGPVSQAEVRWKLYTILPDVFLVTDDPTYGTLDTVNRVCY